MYFTSGSDRPLNSSCRRGWAQTTLTTARPERRRIGTLLKDLSLINREQIDAIQAAVRELEQAEYIVRSRERDGQGRLRGADYLIYEQPQPAPDSPTLKKPMLENPTQ